MGNGSLIVSFWVSIAILAASIEPIIVKLGYLGPVTPVQLLALKSLFGGLFILPLTRTWRWIGLNGLRKVLMVSSLLLATNGLTLFALQRLPAVAVITVVITTPAFVALVNQRLGRDLIGGKFWLGFGLCITGVILGLDLHGLSFDPLGTLLIFGAVISSTIYRVSLENITSDYAPNVVSTYIFLINGLVAALFIAPVSAPFPEGSWQLGAWLGLAAAAANVAFLYALHLLGSTRISIINMLQRPLIVIAAALILKESLTIPKILGVLLVLAGIQIATIRRARVLSESSPDPNFVRENVAVPAVVFTRDPSLLEHDS